MDEYLGSEQRPSEHVFLAAFTGIPPASVVEDKYTWVEKYIPYNNETDNYVHYFVRFN